MAVRYCATLRCQWAANVADAVAPFQRCISVGRMHSGCTADAQMIAFSIGLINAFLHVLASFRFESREPQSPPPPPWPYAYSKAWCLRNRLIEIRLAVLSSISHAILEIRAG